MQEQNQHDYFSQLISRYLSGNTNAAEQQELEQWVLADPDHKKQFIAFKKAWMLSGMRGKQDASVDNAWQKTSAKLFLETKVRTLSTRGHWLKIAAAVIVLVICGTLVYRQFQSPQPFLAQTTTVIMPYDLADGTRVTLNKSSSIRFSPQNEEGEREVQLEGDAFFDVARDESSPFVIATQDIEIEVLGTSFYVDSRENQPNSQVIVQSGQVAVRVGGQEIILNANEQAIYQKGTKQLIKQINQDTNYLALKSGELVFRDTPLETVVFELNRYYNAKIILGNEDLNSCILTSVFKNKSLETVLKILETSLGITYQQREDEIVLAGSCDEE